MKRKHLIFALIILLIIAGIAIIIKVAYDLNTESKIKNEILQISNVFDANNIDDDDASEILNRRIIEKGSYKEVEDSIKNYYQTLYSDLKNLMFLLDEDNFSNYLTGTNLTDDAPSFIKSKENLSNSNAQIIEYYNKFINELTDESTILSFIEDKDISSYYRNFYLELTSIYTTDEFIEAIDTKYNNTISKIDTYNEIFDFLIVNKGHWAIKNEVIIFDDTTLYESYTSLTNNLTNDSSSSAEDESENETDSAS